MTVTSVKTVFRTGDKKEIRLKTAETTFAGLTEARVRDLEKVHGIDSHQK
ncbi:MAG: hypothetical protein L3J69_17395 [Desulfobacula sp.]|nr:hypothetical protein [Desulfobacula sp.]